MSGWALTASQIFRSASVWVVEAAQALASAGVGRIQVLQSPTGPAPDRSLAASLDRDRQFMMNGVHVALAVVAAWMLLRPPSPLDAVVDASLPAQPDSVDPQSYALPLWVALVTASQAFMETATGAIAASRNGLVLASAPPGGTALSSPTFNRFVGRIAARTEAESRALDWLPAIQRTVREALGVSSGGQFVRAMTTGLGWLAHGLSRSSGIEAQRHALRQMHIVDPRPDAPAFDEGVANPEAELREAQERPLGEIMDRYDVYLGTTGSGLHFEYRRPEGDA